MSRNRHGMVRWHNPVQLLRTGIEIFVSQELNARADLRLLEVQTGSDPDFTEGSDPVGDVYPVASREAYEERLKAPFDAASADANPELPPHVYAIPGIMIGMTVSSAFCVFSPVAHAERKEGISGSGGRVRPAAISPSTSPAVGGSGGPTSIWKEMSTSSF